MKKKEIIKRCWCAWFHQNEWKKYVVSVDPQSTIAVCCKCGSDHVVNKGFITREEIDRNIDKALKMRLP